MDSGRRNFIKRSVAGVLALLGLGYLLPGMRILLPVREREKELTFFPLMPEDDLPRSSVRKSELSYTVGGRERKTRVFIVALPDGPAVFSATCSHLGCLVNYRKETGEFVCPCHGGRYDLTGRNIAGPPPAPLTRFPLRVCDGIVNVGMRI